MILKVDDTFNRKYQDIFGILDFFKISTFIIIIIIIIYLLF